MAGEYWCNRGLEITVEGPEGRFCAKVEKPFARVGRHESSEYVLPDRRAPHRGLYLHATEGGVYYIRLTSSPSEKGSDLRGWIGPDQTLDVGPYRVMVQLTNGPAKAETPLPDFEGRDCLPPHPALKILDHGKTIAYCRLRRKLSVVGRGQHCTLRMANLQISACHCVLYREEDKLWAIDLLSTNGTFLAGQPAEAALIAPGQSLRLGSRVELIYLPAPPADDNLDDLSLHVTSRMVESGRQNAPPTAADDRRRVGRLAGHRRRRISLL